MLTLSEAEVTEAVIEYLAKRGVTTTSDAVTVQAIPELCEDECDCCQYVDQLQVKAEVDDVTLKEGPYR